MDYYKTQLERNLAEIRERMARAAERSGLLPREVQLVAVSKKQPIDRILALEEIYSAERATLVIGENQVQEFKKKKPLLGGATRAHMIGTLQSNKVRDAVRLFDLIESVHDERIARLIDEEAQRLGKRQEVFLQVNISEDPAKSGFSPESLIDFVRAVLPGLASVECRGLMTITRQYENREDTRPDFRALRALRDRIAASSAGTVFRGKPIEISMGMSEDYDLAIEEGATFVRIGTALFGERPAD